MSFTWTHVRAVVPAAVAALAGFGSGLLTPGPADASFPGDNGWIAYESSSTGLEIDRDIWATRQTTEGVWTAVRLTSDPIITPRRDLFPAVSPNGKEVAFSRRHPTETDDTELWTMDAMDRDGDGFGDALAPLTDNPVSDVQAAWSPNGKKLAYSSSPPDVPAPPSSAST